MNRIILVIFSVALLSNSAGAINNGPKKTAQTDVSMLILTYVLVKTGIQLGTNGFGWLAAHFGFGEVKPADIPLDSSDEVNAQLALDEVLNNQVVHKANMARLLNRLERQSVGQLLKVILAPRLLPEVRFLARKVLRQKHILPILAEGNYDKLGNLNQLFRRFAGRNHPEAREIALELFDFSHPDPQVELSEPTLHQFLRIHQGTRSLGQAVREWTGGTRLGARVKYVQELTVSGNPALEEVQTRVIALFYEAKKFAQEPGQELVDALHALHTSLLFFDSLMKEHLEEPTSKAAPGSVNAIIDAALKSSGSERFPLTGDFESDAWILGFEQDLNAISAAKENDSSDSSHRISKGGGNSFNRGGLIISPDGDKHAGDALKLHIDQGKGRWVYLDTVILVQIDGNLLFLCLGRNKELSQQYWSLVDPNGNWFRVQRNKPTATLEPADGPQKKVAPGARPAPLKSQPLPFKRI